MATKNWPREVEYCPSMTVIFENRDITVIENGSGEIIVRQNGVKGASVRVSNGSDHLMVTSEALGVGSYNGLAAVFTLRK